MIPDPHGVKHAWVKPFLYAIPFAAVNRAVLGVGNGLFATLMVWLALVVAFDA